MKLKKWLSLLLAAMLLFGALSVTALAAEETPALPRDVTVTVTRVPAPILRYNGFGEGVQFETDPAAAGALLRTAMSQHQDQLVVYYQISGDSFDASEAAFYALINQITESALAHTGNPTEGDYLKWGYERIPAGIRYYKQSGYYFLELTFLPVYYTTATQEAELTAAIDQLIASFGFTTETTDKEKLDTIYAYLTDNIVYDHEHKGDDTYKLKHTAYAALIQKKAVCQGYAQLLYRMLLQVGIDNRLIAGLSLGDHHAWNIVRLGSVYYNVDATWDAQYTQSGWDYAYYLKSQADFDTHDRDFDYLTDAFMAEYPMSPYSYGTSADCESAGGHTPVTDEAKAPTCTETGLTEGSHCGVCGTILTAQETVSTIDHSYTPTVTAPTCTEAGFTTYTCTCGDTYTSDPVDATGHSGHVWKVKTAPTETEPGLAEGTCSICGTTEQIEMPARQNGNYVYSQTENPTCTTPGRYTYTWKSTQYGDISYNGIIAAPGHTKTYTVTTEPTFAQTGTLHTSCANCDLSEDTTIPMLGSDAYAVYVETEATCDQTGVVHYFWINDYGTFSFDVTLEKKTHSPVYFVTTQPTSTTPGILTGVCENCTTVELVDMPCLNEADFTCQQIKAPTEKEPGFNRYTWNVTDYGTFSFDVTVPVLSDEEPEETNPSETPTQPEEEEQINPFEDVPEEKFFYEPVLWAYYGGITTGKDATHFNPSGSCTRSQVVTFLWRAAGQPEPESLHNPFPDVPAGKYYTKAVLWAVEQGITAGYKDGTFGPNDACTRGQIVTFLWRYFDQPEPESLNNPFPDVVESKFYYTAVLWAVENGITGGFRDGTFGPGKTCTRDQIVTFLYRGMVG